jgi:peptidoglycan-associated lipoprotein
MNFNRLTIAAALACACWTASCTKKVAHTSTPAAPTVQAPTPVSTPESRPTQPTAVAETRTPDRPRYPDDRTLVEIDKLLSRIQDAYFDYDKHNLRSDALETLKADASTLATIIRQYPDFKLLVEGHCDERGSEAYNLALGDARAQRAKEYLISFGLPADQMNVVSYGKEKPACSEHDEGCWQKNRRAHLTRADARIHQ